MCKINPELKGWRCKGLGGLQRGAESLAESQPLLVELDDYLVEGSTFGKLFGQINSLKSDCCMCFEPT